MPAPWILTEPLAGLRAQVLGLAEAAGLNPEVRDLTPKGLWRRIPARFWPNPLNVTATSLTGPKPDLVIGCGGMAGAVLAALRTPTRAVVQVQNPRMDLKKFDLIVANRHDEITGPNVIVIRTALHRVTPKRLAEQAAIWRDRLADLPRPFVAVLLGGSNGRYRLDESSGGDLASGLAAMMRRNNIGVMVTPSRRTDPAVTAHIKAAIAPLGGRVWDGTGDNPYFGMLALADLIVVTQDSVSMISEAAATSAPVLVAPLPGRSRRQALFLQTMRDAGRIRMFSQHYDQHFAPWSVQPMNDTPEAAYEMCRRLGLPLPTSPKAALDHAAC